METRSKATRDLALSDDVIPSAEFPARMGESTPASGDLGHIGAAGIVGDSRPSSTRPPTEMVSPHMSIHEADIDGPPPSQRADLAPITSTMNPCPPRIYTHSNFMNFFSAICSGKFLRKYSLKIPLHHKCAAKPLAKYLILFYSHWPVV